MEGSPNTIDGIGRDVTSRITTSIGAAIFAVSLAGLVHAWIGLQYPYGLQWAYALLGGLACWRRVR